MALNDYSSDGNKQAIINYSIQYDYRVVVSIDSEPLSENQFISLYTMEDYLIKTHVVQILAIRLHVFKNNDLFKKLTNSNNGNTCEVNVDIYRRANESREMADGSGSMNDSPYILYRSITKQGYLDPVNIDFNATDLKIIGADEDINQGGSSNDIKVIRMALFDKIEFGCKKKAVINTVLSKGFNVEQAVTYGLDTSIHNAMKLCIAKPDNRSVINTDTLIIPMGIYQYLEFLDTLYGIYYTDYNIFIKDRVLYLNNWNKKDPFNMPTKEEDKYTVMINPSTSAEYIEYGINDTNRMIQTRKEHVKIDSNMWKRGDDDIVSNSGTEPVSFHEVVDNNNILVYNTGTKRMYKPSQGDMVSLSIKLPNCIIPTVNPAMLFDVNMIEDSKTYRIKSYTELILQEGASCGIELFTYNDKKDV